MACLFCKSENIQHAAYPRPTRFNEKIFHYRQCKDCDLIFIDPLPDSDDYDKMYSKAYHETFYFKETSPDFTHLMDALSTHVGNKTLVDYGCGDGSFLRFFAKAGYHCIGVEYDPELVKVLRDKDPGIRYMTVEEFWSDPSLSFSIIYFGDVLEHLGQPLDFLQKVQARLEQDGLLMAQGPLENNQNLGLAFRKLTSGLAGKERIATHVPYHISFSTAKNQEMLFQKAGFKTLVFKVKETPWPFPSRLQKHPLKAVQYLVGQTSVLTSKILPGKMGNRFIYVGRKSS